MIYDITRSTLDVLQGKYYCSPCTMYFLLYFFVTCLCFVNFLFVCSLGFSIKLFFFLMLIYVGVVLVMFRVPTFMETCLFRTTFSLKD